MKQLALLASLLVAATAWAESPPIEGKILALCELKPLAQSIALTNGAIVRVWISDGNSHSIRLHHLVAYGDDMKEWTFFRIHVSLRPPVDKLDLAPTGRTSWLRLKSLGILTLRDQAKVDFPMPYDAARYSVRVLQGGTVRTYSYYAPDVVPRPDDKAFAKIAQILESEVKRERSNKTPGHVPSKAAADGGL